MNRRMTIGVALAMACVGTQAATPLVERVKADFGPQELAQPIVHYAVPAMSGVQRLPDAYPSDGRAGAAVRIVMARDEYEPGSFVIWANRDVGKVQLELSEFKQVEKVGGGGERETGVVFPKENLDLKVVKVWYQNRNAWYSYFGDTGFALCPELLLNDEDLIRVDEKKSANYARIREKDGKVREQWLNPPRQLDRVFWDAYRGGDAFACMRPGFEDADTLQPVKLIKHGFKQFLLTAHATKDTAPGLYKGNVILRSTPTPNTYTYSIPVEIKVLDLTLPKPMCYFDDNKPFLVNFYSYECFGMMMELNGGDIELTKRQAAAVLKNHAAHGQDINWLRWSFFEGEGTDYQKMSDEAGYNTKVACGSFPTASGGDGNDSGTLTERTSGVRRSLAAARRMFGDRDFYKAVGDEPPPWWLQKMRSSMDLLQSNGYKLILAGSDTIYRKAGFRYEWHNISSSPENARTPALWNQFGSSPYVAWYAGQHVGNENPDFNRRQNGMAAYLNGYSCLCNYAHHFGSFNDDSEGYKPMVFTYGQSKGCIDTLAWEGFREGLDDIRYATVLVKLARQAAKDEKNMRRRFEANKALQMLVEFRREADDLNECRMEMIRYILKLQKL